MINQKIIPESTKENQLLEVLPSLNSLAICSLKLFIISSFLLKLTIPKETSTSQVHKASKEAKQIFSKLRQSESDEILIKLEISASTSFSDSAVVIKDFEISWFRESYIIREGNSFGKKLGILSWAFS